MCSVLRCPLTSLSRLSVLVSLSVCGLSACVERPTSELPAQVRPDMGAPEMSASGDLGALGAGDGVGSLNGTWLLVHEQSSCILRQEQLALTDYLVEIEQTGQSLRERRRVCALTLSPVLGLSITVPEAAYRTIDFVEIDRGIISSAQTGGRYSSSTEVGLWGVTLEDVLEDPLPREADDPAVKDADEDGNPAVTFLVGDSCARYNVQRQVIRYDGSLVAPNRVEGGSTSITEAVALGSSRPICGSSPSLQVNDRFNRFVMVRVDGLGGAYNADVNGDGQISCEEARGLGQRLNPGRMTDAQNCR